MHLKDHYRALGVEPSATIPEIKTAYRRLAQQYHPDKTNHDPYATAQFAAIKEAYETLTNPAKKELYLQHRWYYQSLGKKKTQEVITPVSVLKQVLELDKYVSKLDIHRMDKDGLFQYTREILQEETINTINSFNEPLVNKEIVGLMIRISRYLSYKQFLTLSPKLIMLSPDESVAKTIKQYVRHHRQSAYWEKYKPWLFLLIVVFICMLIFLLAD